MHRTGSSRGFPARAGVEGARAARRRRIRGAAARGAARRGPAARRRQGRAAAARARGERLARALRWRRREAARQRPALAPRRVRPGACPLVSHELRRLSAWGARRAEEGVHQRALVGRGGRARRRPARRPLPSSAVLWSVGGERCRVSNRSLPDASRPPGAPLRLCGLLALLLLLCRLPGVAEAVRSCWAPLRLCGAAGRHRWARWRSAAVSGTTPRPCGARTPTSAAAGSSRSCWRRRCPPVPPPPHPSAGRPSARLHAVLSGRWSRARGACWAVGPSSASPGSVAVRVRVQVPGVWQYGCGPPGPAVP